MHGLNLAATSPAWRIKHPADALSPLTVAGRRSVCRVCTPAAARFSNANASSLGANPSGTCQRQRQVAAHAFGREAFVVGMVGTFVAYLALNADEIARKQKIAVAKAEAEQAAGLAAAKAKQQAGAEEAQRKIEEGRKAAEEAARRAQQR